MIKYALICEHEHAFEAWFSSAADYDAQAESGLLACAHCGTANVEKAIMAPNVSTSRKKDAIAQKHQAAMNMMNAAAQDIRKEIEDKCDYVGDKFADEARAIHYGEKPERGIYGEASAKEAVDLSAEGVAVAPLPEALTPKPKKDLN